jgi:hypothetical protein
MWRGGIFSLWVAVLAATSVQAGIITATNNTTANVDGVFVARSVTVTDATSGYDLRTILGMRITIDFAKAAGFGFDPPYSATGNPFYNEASFALFYTPPGQSFSLGLDTRLNLVLPDYWPSNSQGFFSGEIVFASDALDSVPAAGPGAGPFLPQVIPAQPQNTFDLFLGEDAAGMWTLRIGDLADGDSLRFRSFTLEITTQSSTSNGNGNGNGGGDDDIPTAPAEVPEPSSLALMMVAAGAAMAVRFRRPRGGK